MALRAPRHLGRAKRTSHGPSAPQAHISRGVPCLGRQLTPSREACRADSSRSRTGPVLLPSFPAGKSSLLRRPPPALAAAPTGFLPPLLSPDTLLPQLGLWHLFLPHRFCAHVRLVTGGRRMVPGMQWPCPRFISPLAGTQTHYAHALNVSTCWEVPRGAGCMNCRHELAPQDERLPMCTVQKVS